MSSYTSFKRYNQTMLKKIIIVILSLILISMLGKAFLKFFEWDIEFGEPQKVWAKITTVKVIEHKRLTRRYNTVIQDDKKFSYQRILL